MAKTSQNGWTAGTPAQIGGLDDFTVAGVDFPQGFRRGAVAVIFRHFAEQFHRRIEPLKAGWCWGYHYKQIEGSNDLSNHASGTAGDFNAPRHPIGKKGTFTPKQTAEIRKLIAEYDGVLRWGGDYRGRVDEMHVEIIGSAAAVARVAAKLTGQPKPPAPKPPAGGRPAPTPAVAFPLPSGCYFGRDNGSNSSVSGKYGRTFKGRTDRAWIQEFGNQLRRRGWAIGAGRTWLGGDGNNGIFGPEYDRLVRAFQADQGLKVDGELGPKTWAAAYHNPIR